MESVQAQQAPAAAGSATLEVRLLGCADWTAGDRASAVPDARAGVLIAMVALDGPLPRNQAAEMFWPRSEGAARTNLRVLMHRLKQAAGVPLFAPGDRVALLPHVHVDIAGSDAEIVERCLQLGTSSLRLLHVIEMPSIISPEPATIEIDFARIREAAVTEVRRRLHELIPEEARTFCTPETAVVRGGAHREILRQAADRRADLIVMGVHGRGAVDVLLFGSTTQHVIRASACPVLIVRGA